jgi:hypothetical protein
MKLLLKNPMLRNDVLFKPQWGFISNEIGENVVDFVGRFESLQMDFELVCERVGLPQINLEQRNITNHDNYKQYLDDELMAMLSGFYKLDLKKLGYCS